MGSLLTNRARAYVNHGRWIADCVGEYCNSARLLEPHQPMFHCVDCKAMADIEWPANADMIWRVLALRPNPANRNWFPSGHGLALRSNRPHGQTVADLRAENVEHGVRANGLD